MSSPLLVPQKWWDDETIEEVSSPKRERHIELDPALSTRDDSAPVGLSRVESLRLSQITDFEEPDIDVSSPVTARVHPARNFQMSKKAWAVIVVLAAAVMLTLTGWGVARAVGQSAHSTALSECQKAVKTVRDAAKEVTAVVEKKQHVSTISVDEVADPSTLEALEKALKVSSPLDLACESVASTEDLTRNTKALDKNAQMLTSQTTAVKRAARNVRLSQEQKQLDNATTSLDTVVATAQKTYDSTSEKVADEATREALKTALSAAQEELKNSARSVESLKACQESVQRAVSGVKTSVAKKHDDEIAKTQAEAHTPTPAPSPRSQPLGGGYSQGSSSGGSGAGSTGQESAPRSWSVPQVESEGALPDTL